MSFTKDKPTEEGFYICRNKNKLRLYAVCPSMMQKGTFLAFKDNCDFERLSSEIFDGASWFKLPVDLTNMKGERWIFYDTPAEDTNHIVEKKD